MYLQSLSKNTWATIAHSLFAISQMNYQAILDRKLKTLFPQASARQKLSALLESYGSEDYEREPERVRLAILKPSASDAKKLQEYLDIAKIDYRDVLAMAEYPRQLKDPSFTYDEDKQKLIDADRTEYEKWLSD